MSSRQLLTEMTIVVGICASSFATLVLILFQWAFRDTQKSCSLLQISLMDLVAYSTSYLEASLPWKPEFCPPKMIALLRTWCEVYTLHLNGAVLRMNARQ
jgi:hypothetical protein